MTVDVELEVGELAGELEAGMSRPTAHSSAAIQSTRASAMGGGPSGRSGPSSGGAPRSAVEVGGIGGATGGVAISY